MDTPLVTVVTVVRNLVEAGRLDTFRQCVESVRGQSWPAVEHLVVDGASTDGTLDILDDYAGRKIFAYHSESDHGLYDAMNKSVCRARGEFVTFLNSDDFYHDPRFLEQSVAALRQTGADCSYAPVRVWDSQGTVSERLPLLGATLLYLPICHQTVVYKTSTLHSYPFHLDFTIAADYEQILRILLDGRRFCEVPLCGVTFRDGGWSVHNIARGNADIVKVHRSLYPTWGMRMNHCDRLQKSHHIPRSVFKALLKSIAPEHRPLFEEWRRRDARRRLKHWFLTWKRREGRRSIRILGIWLVQDA